jgi:hypothetical protein
MAFVECQRVWRVRAKLAVLEFAKFAGEWPLLSTKFNDKIYAKAGRPEAYKKAKASMLIVCHHLRSLNKVNEGHNMKNMSLERIT